MRFLRFARKDAHYSGMINLCTANCELRTANWFRVFREFSGFSRICPLPIANWCEFPGERRERRERSNLIRGAQIYEIPSLCSERRALLRHNQPENCGLLTAYCVLQTANCELRTANCELRTAYCIL